MRNVTCQGRKKRCPNSRRDSVLIIEKRSINVLYSHVTAKATPKKHLYFFVP